MSAPTCALLDVPSPVSQEDGNCTEGPLPTVQQVLQCQFSSWYPIFSNLPRNNCNTESNGARRSNVTLKSVILQLPDQFRDYLAADSLQLPLGAKVSSCMFDDNLAASDSEWSSGDDDDDDDNGGTAKNDDPPPQQFHFDELNTNIASAIASLGGSVVPKLNWSAPKDAVWINSGSLKSQSAGDIYLLLKSSDFCSYDAALSLTETVLQPATNHQWPLQLALRKWCNLYPSQEFRCFCSKGNLVAISQRNHSQHYAHTVREQFLYRSFIVEFFDEVIVPNWPVVGAADANTNGVAAADATTEEASYVFDVYIDKKERVWLVDFNVWGRQTDTLLYQWLELEQMEATDQPEIRVVETDRQVRQDPLSSYRAPIDTVHVASMTGGDASKFKEFMDLCERPTVLGQEEEEAADVDGFEVDR